MSPAWFLTYENYHSLKPVYLLQVASKPFPPFQQSGQFSNPERNQPKCEKLKFNLPPQRSHSSLKGKQISSIASWKRASVFHHPTHTQEPGQEKFRSDTRRRRRVCVAKRWTESCFCCKDERFEG